MTANKLGSKFSRSSSADSSGSTSSASTNSETLRHQLNLNLAAPQAAQEDLSPLRCFVNALTRKKPLDCRTDTELNRCLSFTQLTALGVGSTLGLGLYVLAGQVASNKAGPAVVLSFALAALASLFSALCYAEFAGRVPRAGSAYAYSYISVGEFVAFVIGWNLVLEYVIGASSVARGFSGYLRVIYADVSRRLSSNPPLVGNQTEPPAYLMLVTTPASLLANESSAGALQSAADYLAEYFDWPSVAIVALLTVFLLFGVKESTNATMFFTAINLLVVLAVVISSLGSLDLHNWRLTKSEVPAGFGDGGFLPYGWSGVLAGSATCFFGFIGFDTIAASAEEAKNPKRNVPLSIMVSLLISFVAYISVALVQTLLWPYYDQNNITILPFIFDKLHMPATYWIVLVGAVAGLSSSQLGGVYPLPRILYSMANDKLIYSALAKINRRLKLPVRATITGSVLVAALACLLDIQDLADMVSIGTLAAYSLVSLSVLILRYENRSDALDDSTILTNHLSFTDILGAQLEQQPPAEPEHPKLAHKASTPIREKGSRAVVAQLSVGFHSWFKSTSGSAQLDESLEMTHTGKSGNRKQSKQTPSGSFLDLLISWKTNQSAQIPNDYTSWQSKILIFALVTIATLLDLVAYIYLKLLAESSASNPFSLDPKLLIYSSACILLVLLASVMLMLSRLPNSKSMQSSEMFQVPWVPLVPILSIFVNTFLMLNLSYLTWVRFTVWMAFGLFIYFTYGIWNSEGYLLYLGR